MVGESVRIVVGEKDGARQAVESDRAGQEVESDRAGQAGAVVLARRACECCLWHGLHERCLIGEGVQSFIAVWGPWFQILKVQVLAWKSEHHTTPCARAEVMRGITIDTMRGAMCQQMRG